MIVARVNMNSNDASVAHNSDIILSHYLHRHHRCHLHQQWHHDHHDDDADNAHNSGVILGYKLRNLSPL